MVKFHWEYYCCCLIFKFHRIEPYLKKALFIKKNLYQKLEFEMSDIKRNNLY